MGLFQEYMDAKGQVKKPVVDIHGGKPTPATPPTKPPKEHGNAPYIAKGEKGGKKGFGDLGDTKCKCDGKEPAPAKIPTAEHAEIAALVTDVMLKDGALVEQLVYQLKNKGLLGVVVAEMLTYKETYQHLTEIMAHESYGPKVCGKLIRAMNEEVAPPLSASLEGEDIEDDADEAEEGDEFDNEFSGDMEGIDDEDIDMQDADFEMDPAQAADPLMMDPTMQQQAPGQAPMAPPHGQAMMHLQRAMMRR